MDFYKIKDRSCDNCALHWIDPKGVVNCLLKDETCYEILGKVCEYYIYEGF